MIVEIRAAEGGDDAKLLVREMLSLYRAAAQRHGFGVDKVSAEVGLVTFVAAGPSAAAFFADEAGGHRWQRVPPTEKRGRVQTSTVTVAVLGEQAASPEFRPELIEWEFFCAGGPGGQNQNKRASGARGRLGDLIVESRAGRDQATNRKLVVQEMRRRVLEGHVSRAATATNGARRAQIGSGQRGDKIRTYRERDDSVVDDRTGRRARLSRLRRGDWAALK